MSDPKYGYLYPAQGDYQGPPVMAWPESDRYCLSFVDHPPGDYEGPYQGPPVMGGCRGYSPPVNHYPPSAPPRYASPPPRREPSFLEGCLAALCCCCLIDECCCDPSIIFVS